MRKLSPIGWAVRPLKNYARFSGRASRAEFWWFFLFMMVLYAVMWIALFSFGGLATHAEVVSPGRRSLGAFGAFGALGVFAVFVMIFWLAILIPVIAVQVRRLHDIDRSGWWLGAFWILYLIYIASVFARVLPLGAYDGSSPSLVGAGALAILALAMFVYSIVLLVFWCLPGTRGANRFGEDPYGADFEEVFA